MPELSCKKEVQSFIGIINYLPNFSTRLSKLSKPIRKLSKDRVLFNWGPEHCEAFNMIKKEIAKAPILVDYDPNKEMVLQTDASIKGLGHASCNKASLCTLPVKLSLKPKKGM